MNLFFILLQQQPNPLTSLLPLFLIIIVFYFFMIRPQMRRQKELRNFRSSLQKNDKIITTGGIYGKVTDIKDATVTVEIAENLRIKVDKNAVVKDPGDLTDARK